MGSNKVEIIGPSSDIAGFFAGRSVFVTGGTGFLGKVLVQRLLSTCPDIGAIFLLIRGKKSTCAEERLRALLLESPVFASLRQSDLRKVHAVSGDIAERNLGLSAEDEAALLTHNVSVIFHSAATVKFDDELTKTLEMNVTGTRSVMTLAKKMVGLKAFVHVSTAFCHCHEKVIEERLYLEPALSAREITDTAITRQKNGVKKGVVIGPRPNTYTFSKAVAEQLLHEERGDLPIAIVRPSIVVASAKDPFPGWIDNFNGPTGIIAGAGTGLLRSMVVDRDCVADLIPVDIVINLMCAVAYKMGTGGCSAGKGDDIPVFHCTSGSANPITWREIEKFCYESILVYPMEKIFWYPGGGFKSSKCVDVFLRFFTNWIPAYLADIVILACGGKPYLVKLIQKMSKGISVLEYFATREWQWTDSNGKALFDSLSETDRHTFNFDIAQLNWRVFLDNYVLGTRQYVLNYRPSTMERSRKKLRQMYVLHVATMTVLYFLPIMLVYMLFIQ